MNENPLIVSEEEIGDKQKNNQRTEIPRLFALKIRVWRRSGKVGQDCVNLGARIGNPPPGNLQAAISPVFARTDSVVNKIEDDAAWVQLSDWLLRYASWAML